MKILTATSSGANAEDDFCFTVEGEIVVPSFVCDSPTCGCDRSFSGLNSHKGTTTVMVKDVALDLEDLVEGAIGFVEASGYAKMMREDPDPEDENDPDPVKSFARDLIEDSIDMAADYDVGTVLHLRFDRDKEAWTTYS